MIVSDSGSVISISNGEEMQLNICFQSDDITVIHDDDINKEDEVAEEREEELEKLEAEPDEYDENEGDEDNIKTITNLDSCIQDSDACDNDNEEERVMESRNFVKSLSLSLSLSLSFSLSLSLPPLNY